MSNRDALISISMLTTLMEANKSDSLDLLAPYVKYVLAERCSPGSLIDLNLVKAELQKFGFRSIPENVLKKLLGRFKRQGIVEFAEGRYRLLKTLSSERTKFLQQRDFVKSETNAVIEALKAYINDHPVRPGTINDAKAIEIFEIFLREKGYLTLENADHLSSVKDSALPYLFPTAQFILAAQANEPDLFEKIMRVVKGFMLSKVIYAQQNLELKGKRFSSLDIYLDTHLILSVFGYNDKAENECVSTMLDLLRRCGARLKCFTHTYQELYNIIFAYKESLRDQKNRSVFTLQHFDENHYKVSDVEIVLSRLNATFERHGISVVSVPDYPTNDYSWCIDEKELKTTLAQHVGYRTNDKGEQPSLDNDVASVAAITRIRQDIDFEEIGSCKAIFVSSNYALVNSANRRLKHMKVPFLMDDIELTTVVWLRSESLATSSDLSTLTLVANARASLELTDEMIGAFVKRVKILEANGDLSDAETQNIIYMIYHNREGLMREFDGDEERMKEASAAEMRNAAIEYYTPELQEQLKQTASERDEESKRNEQLSQENEQLRAEKARILAEQKKAEDERNKVMHEEKQNRIKKAQDKAEASKKHVILACRLICVAFAVLVAALATILFVRELLEGASSQSLFMLIASAMVVLLDIIGVIDTLRDKGRVVGRFILWLGQKRYTRVYNQLKP